MKRTLTLTLASLLLGCSLASNRALIVNTSLYQQASLDLPGNAHNAGLASRFAEALGFQPTEQVVLQNQQATRDSILQLLQEASKQDRVLVYLAGRGTLLPGGEQGCQEALVLHNQQTLLIDEVRQVLQQGLAREVLLLTDAGYQDPLQRAIGVGETTLERFQGQALPGQPHCALASPPSPLDTTRQGYVELHAALPTENSWSTPEGSLFTRLLTDAVVKNPQITFGALQVQLQNQIDGFTRQQGLSPQNPHLLFPARLQGVRMQDFAPSLPLLQGTLKGHGDEVQTVTFSPDGRTLAYALDRYLFLADASTGQTLQVLGGHTGTVHAVAFSPDGKRLLTGSDDQTARLWDLQQGKILKTFTGHRLAVDAVAFGPDGKWILTGSRDKTARLWDVATGTVLKTLSGHDSLVFAVAFSPDGTQLLTASDFVARLWNRETGALLKTFSGHTDFVTSVAFSLDGKRVLTGSQDQTAILWDLGTGTPLQTFSGHTGTVYSVGFSPDGKGVLTGSQDHTVRLWNVENVQALQTFSGHSGAVYSARFSPDGRQVLSGSQDQSARLWDVQSEQLLQTLSGYRSGVELLALSPDGRQLLTASGTTTQLWDVQKGLPLLTLPEATGQVRAVAFSPDGKQLLTAGDYALQLFDARTGSLLKTFSGHSDLISSAVFSPDGRFLLSASKDSTVRLWSVNTAETLKILRGHQQPITTALFSPDGRWILTGSLDSTARLWSVSTAETLKTFSGHTRPVQEVAFTPDGRTVLTAGEDRTLRVWNAQTGQQLAAYGVSSPHFQVGRDGTVLAHQDCMTLQHIQLSTGSVLQEFALGDRCFGGFEVSQDGRVLVTDSGQLQDASTLSVFGFPRPAQGFFQQQGSLTALQPQAPEDPKQVGPLKTAEKRVALVIGNDAYQHAAVLDNPLRDALLIEKQLKQAGFEVVLASNVTRASFDQAIRQFRTLLSDADVALLYYSGHGLQVSGINRMVPIDARLNTLQDVDFETITVDFVMEQMDQEGVATKLIILDACRTNPFLKSTRSLKADGLAAMKASRGSLIAFATAPGMPASDGHGQNSPYAKALGKHMLTPGLTIEQVFKRVRQDVLNETRGEQEPWENSSLLTDLYFVR